MTFRRLEIVIYFIKIWWKTKELAYPVMFVLNKVSNDNIMKDWFLFPVYDSPILRHIILMSVCFYVWTMWWVFVLKIRTLKLPTYSIVDCMSSSKIRAFLKSKDSYAGFLSSKVHHDVHLASSSLECLSGLTKQQKPHGSFILIYK